MSVGRKPIPSAVRELRGNPGKRKGNDREPKPELGAPPEPSELTPLESKLWKKLCGELRSMGVLYEVDGEALRLCIEALADYREAREGVKDAGGPTYQTTSTTGAHVVKLRPEVLVAQDAWRRAKSALVEFGLTPSARTRVKSGEVPSADPFEDFLRHGRKKAPRRAKGGGGR